MGDGDGIWLSTESFGVGSGKPMAAPAAGSRYLLLEPVGEGGHAVVYTAYDRKLNRKIAVKLVRDETLAGESRLVREAQALARLRHPNVVTVYDVGTFEDRVFVAMELIEGQSLRGWLRARSRAWPEVVAVFGAAGRGLAAAHAEGLVHRDFKPDNVLVGDDGAVRVADFGLARLVGEVPAEPATSPSAPSPLLAELTRTGALVGTPRYMAPEQRAGVAVDARSDQFSFCVALYEALFGRPPFDDAAERREPRPPPPETKAPAWLWAVIRRGLSADPGLRWPSMTELLAELDRDRGAPRRRALAAAGGLGAAALIAYALVRPASAPVCSGGAARLAGIWEPPRRDAVRAAFAATGAPYADDSYRRVVQGVDDYLAGWAAMRKDACEATAVRHEQSEALLDLRMRCLDRRLDELDRLVGIFARGPDRGVLDGAVAAVAGLEPQAGCADADALARAVPPPADLATRLAIAPLEAQLAELSALELAGKDAEYDRLAEQTVAEARKLPYPPILARALFALAEAYQGHADGPRAEAVLREGLLVAARGHDDVTTAKLYNLLVRSVGLTQGRPADALALSTFAEAAVIRAGDTPALRGRLLACVGVAQREQGDLAAAQRTLEAALSSLEKDPGRNRVLVGDLLNDLGDTLLLAGAKDEARARFDQALAVFEEVLAPGNPRMGMTYGNLGEVLHDTGHRDEAVAALRRALAIFEGSEGPDGPEVGEAARILAAWAAEAGDLVEARRMVDRALTIWLARVGPDHVQVAQTLRVRAGIAIAERAFEPAERDAARAVAIEERSRGPEHAYVAEALRVLARVHIAAGRPRAALPLLERALAIDGKHGDAGRTGRAEDLAARSDALAAISR